MCASAKQDSPFSGTIIVGIRTDEALDREYRFKTSFRIGRSEECEVCINNEFVSRSHVRISIENGEWWLCDLNSSNGVFLGDQRVLRVALKEGLRIRLGVRGPEVSLRVISPIVESLGSANKR